MDEPEPRIYEFEDFRLDAADRVLLRNGEPLPLTPRVFDTLLYFVRHQGRVLGKDDLMSAIWPDSFVTENNLSQNISTLRQLLGERRGVNHYIITVPEEATASPLMCERSLTLNQVQRLRKEPTQMRTRKMRLLTPPQR
jgi:DNA-binding response OmpR family regulator